MNKYLFYHIKEVRSTVMSQGVQHKTPECKFKVVVFFQFLKLSVIITTVKSWGFFKCPDEIHMHIFNSFLKYTQMSQLTSASAFFKV